MKPRLSDLIILVAALLQSLAPQYAAAEAGRRTIRIVGREEATVTMPEIRLGDLAQISSSRVEDDEAVIALEKIVIAQAPQAGKELKVSAAEILQELREKGVNLQEVGYHLRRVATVRRAARVLGAGEVRGAIEEYLNASKRDIIIKDISYRDNVKLVPGVTTLSVISLGSSAQGQMTFEIAATVEQEPVVRFRVKASVDEWRELPVAARPIQRGAVIGEEDIKMARLNAAAVPADAAETGSTLVGMEAERNIGFGEPFRLNKLVEPPVVASGEAVTIVYKTPFITATATGVALEAGAAGKEIKVKNLSSKKVLMATVVEPGLVGVK